MINGTMGSCLPAVLRGLAGLAALLLIPMRIDAALYQVKMKGLPDEVVHQPFTIDTDQDPDSPYVSMSIGDGEGFEEFISPDSLKYHWHAKDGFQVSLNGWSGYAYESFSERVVQKRDSSSRTITRNHKIYFFFSRGSDRLEMVDNSGYLRTLLFRRYREDYLKFHDLDPSAQQEKDSLVLHARYWSELGPKGYEGLCTLTVLRVSAAPLELKPRLQVSAARPGRFIRNGGFRMGLLPISGNGFWAGPTSSISVLGRRIRP